MVKLTIDNLSIGGDGIGRLEGKVVFVYGACPGDVLLVDIIEENKNFSRGRIKEIVMPSPHRIKPPCPVADECGGCSWQQISHEEQLAQKQLMLRSSLEKELKTKDLPIKSIRPSPVSFRYRNRIQPQVRSNTLGFYKKGSNTFLEIQDCLITEEALTKEFPKILALKPKDGRIEIRLNQQGLVEWKHIEDGEFEGLGFSQVNRFQNDELINTVVDRIKSLTETTVYDLYAGSGNFSFPIAKQFPQKKVIAVELSALLVEAGRFMQKSLDSTNLTFVEANVDSFLKRTELSGDSIVLVDPPRAGMSQYATKALANSKARHFIYISCHPATLARDLRFLLSENPQLKIEEILPFEMFPQTDHMETIVFLKS